MDGKSVFTLLPYGAGDANLYKFVHIVGDVMGGDPNLYKFIHIVGGDSITSS